MLGMLRGMLGKDGWRVGSERVCVSGYAGVRVEMKGVCRGTDLSYGVWMDVIP